MLSSPTVKLKCYKILILALVLVALGGVMAVGMGGIVQAEPYPEIGKKAPDFTLNDLMGNVVRLSDYKNRVVVLHFWATWCPPCREEMPGLQKLHEKFRDRNFVILALSIDKDRAEKVNAFLIKGGYTFKVLLDQQSQAATLYGVNAIPTTYIIGKDRKIINRHIGMLNWTSAEIEQELTALMRK